MPQNAARHAYLITAHDKPEQLKLLLSLLDDSNNDLYLHIDKKATGIHDSDLTGAIKKASIQFVPRLDARWGSEVFIDAIASLIREAVKRSTRITTCSQRRSAAETAARDSRVLYRARRQGVCRVRPEVRRSAGARPTAGAILLPSAVGPFAIRAYKRFEPVWNKLQSALGVNRIKRCPVVFQKGAVWFSISHAFALYVLEQFPHYRPYYKHSVCADEIWLQTILVNSPFMERRSFSGWDDELAATMRYVDWSDGGRSPKVLVSEDYTALISSGALLRVSSTSGGRRGIDRIAQFVRSRENHKAQIPHFETVLLLTAHDLRCFRPPATLVFHRKLCNCEPLLCMVKLIQSNGIKERQWKFNTAQNRFLKAFFVCRPVEKPCAFTGFQVLFALSGAAATLLFTQRGSTVSALSAFSVRCALHSAAFRYQALERAFVRVSPETPCAAVFALYAAYCYPGGTALP
jgi:hypothetical protein